jgi:outer membrane protein
MNSPCHTSLNKTSRCIKGSTFVAALLGMTFSCASLSADISHSIRNNSQDNATEDYFEFGLERFAGRGPSITDTEGKWNGGGSIVNFSYTWKGLFIERYTESQNPLLLGYNAVNFDNWSFDLILGRGGRGLSSKNNERFSGLEDRQDSTMFGGRLTGSVAGNIVQFTLKRDISGHSKGTRASALIARNWQLRNWNLHGMLGLQYFDGNDIDYYLGVSGAEATQSQFTEYRPGGDFYFTAETGVTYPITEDWVFRATARFRTVSDEALDSPLFLDKRSNVTAIRTSLSYVF